MPNVLLLDNEPIAFSVSFFYILQLLTVSFFSSRISIEGGIRVCKERMFVAK